MKAVPLTDVVTDHGEGPVHCDRWNGPRWVDMLAGDICELQPDGTVERHHIGAVAAMTRPRTNPGWIAADGHGLLITDNDDLHTDTHRLTTLIQDPAVRINEGGCDPAGNLYLGSMAYDSRPGGGSLYKITADNTITTVLPHVSVSNGIGWSPDHQYCYYVDSSTKNITRYRWSPDDGLKAPETLATLDDHDAVYDGLTVDAEGNIWVALFGGSAVHVYSPDGSLADIVDIPARQVTAVTFSGALHDQLIITTSRNGLGNSAEPTAGCIFTVETGVSGQLTQPFAG